MDVKRKFKRRGKIMITKENISKIMNLLFLSPQEILGGSKEKRKLDFVHLISIKLLSGTPLKGRGCKIDPILIKIGFSGIDDDDICNLSEEEFEKILQNFKKFNNAIGAWTLVHDIPATEKRPQWRIAAEVSPQFLREAKIEKIEEIENKKIKKIFCINLEGVGIFIGKPIKNSKKEK
jgi:hypothetical protein